MKKIKLTLEVECSDSTRVSDLVSDLEDGLLCDAVKKSSIEWEENGVLETAELETLTLRRNNMCQKLVIAKYIQNDGEKLVFSVNKYAYTIETSKKINEGDFIVIRDWKGSLNEDCKSVSVVKVVNVFANRRSEEALKYLEDNSTSALRDKELLGKADIKDYFAEIEKKHKREELMHKIEVRFKEAEKEALYRKLAETDPEMKALLSELDSLN